MTQERISAIVECMTNNKEMSEIQEIQTEHRLKLVQFWGIKEGDCVLEIGCGQGDTTAVLAHAVGEKGFVHGIDIASPSYGAPITLGASIDFLKASKLGNQIKIEFETDVLSADVDFPEHAFDCIVFSHCSWYLKSIEELASILNKIRKWGKKLCFAEWDSRIVTIDQYPHFLAVLIQAQYECFKESSLSNIRTLFTPMDIQKIIEKSSWTISHESSIHSPDLQDAEWEIGMTISDYKKEITELHQIPDKLKKLIQSEVMLLEQARNNGTIQPMSAYAFIAK